MRADLPLPEQSLAAVATALRKGELTSTALTQALLERATAAQARLNCFLELDAASALAEAAAADGRRAQGADCGPLHGVPLAHKAMFDHVGQRNLLGGKIEQPVAGADAEVIARLRRAGALSIGQLNMSEFAFGPVGDNRHYGRCRNAINPEFMAGGSSSGSAAATAAGACYASLGSDTGGSVRIPAAANGVVGLKPTYGLVSRRGAMRLAPSIDFIGTLTRNVADCALLLQTIAGFDAADPGSSRRPPPNYGAALTRGVAGLRVGVVSDYFRDGITPDVATAMDRSLTVLQRAGAAIVEVRVPQPEVLAELSRAILYCEATALHGLWLREHGALYSPQVRVRASTGLAIPGSTYYEALCLRAPLLREFVEAAFRDCDVLHMPTLVIPVPRFTDVDVGSGPALWETLSRLVQNTAPFNYLGLPALAVPFGRTDNGMPASVQLVGRPFDEALLLQVAATLE
jgi:aspartyl-tRNA(Asn)/glutamyl-tRNA(Gln) amidotransferase subunit A